MECRTISNNNTRSLCIMLLSKLLVVRSCMYVATYVITCNGDMTAACLLAKLTVSNFGVQIRGNSFAMKNIV